MVCHNISVGMRLDDKFTSRPPARYAGKVRKYYDISCRGADHRFWWSAGLAGRTFLVVCHSPARAINLSPRQQPLQIAAQNLTGVLRGDLNFTERLHLRLKNLGVPTAWKERRVRAE
jgi:hypothetical protein